MLDTRKTHALALPVVVLLLLLALFQRSPAPTRSLATGRVEWLRFYSPALRQRRLLLVYLPPGYAADVARGMRFPVLYLLHGNPGSPTNFIHYAQLVQSVDALVDSHAIRPLLVVMPDGRTSRGDGSDTEWANTTADGPFETLVLEAVHAADLRLPTLADRADRALAGNSSGAFGAINVGLHNLGTFGTLESWSGYFRQFPGAPFTHGPPGVLRTNSPALYLPGLTGKLQRHRLHVWLYSGTQDATRPQLMPFAALLRAAGVGVQANVFPGKHEWSLWRAHMQQALEFASRSFGSHR